MAEIYNVKTFDQIYTAMKQYLIGKSSVLTNFNDGGRTNTILEAVALVVSISNDDYYQALKKAIPVSIFNGWGFSLKAGTYSSGKIKFYRTEAAAQIYTIPIGTSILLNNIRYTTTEAGSIAIGATESAEITASSETIGTISNISLNAIDTISGYGSFVILPNGIEQAISTTAFTGGTDDEVNSARINRFRNYVNGLAKSTKFGLKAGVLGIDGIKSCTILDKYPSAGYVTIVADDGSGSLSPELEAAILKLIEGDETDYDNYPGYEAAGITCLVTAPTIIQLPITASLIVYSDTTYTDAQWQIMAKNAIQIYTNTLSLGEDWAKSQAIADVENINDDDVYSFSISIPTTEIIEADQTEMIKTSTISITITKVDRE